MNDFSTDLDYGNSEDDAAFWESCYRHYFVDFAAQCSHPHDGDHQRVGIDRSVTLNSGKTLKIDEKKRREDYGDILLEYISNDRKGSPGWAEKILLCDYIAYAILPKGAPDLHRAYLLPVPILQSTWKQNKDDWLNKYGTRAAQNNGYRTLNCPVPVSVLFDAMKHSMRFPGFI